MADALAGRPPRRHEAAAALPPPGYKQPVPSLAPAQVMESICGGRGAAEAGGAGEGKRAGGA